MSRCSVGARSANSTSPAIGVTADSVPGAVIWVCGLGTPGFSSGDYTPRFSFREVVGDRGYVADVCRFRLFPTREQAAALAGHCGHARFVWNLAVEQQLHWQ
ncbi:MAG TPA: helix-turn-helix domain-containing protein, partial [Mycobacterium sp.]|uniref:helix-turn-helix domain-containing protein n=1 Tax=Mycobacterium sp. TaxID=1785 RepID=UPI002D6461B2